MVEKKIDKLKRFIPELIVLVIYMIALFIVMQFHEPWFDEAQAWLIARDASIKDILFLLPHYEGHPPLWHLILMILARTGASYEFSLRMVSFIFSSSSMALLLFKAPFDRKIKLLLPFNYFLFYQYGVLSRPYCVFMFGFILAAIFYKEKDLHPFLFVFALSIICSSSAYGIILSAGICIVWVVEILKVNGSWSEIKKILFTKKILSLFILLAYNVLLLVLIMPKADTYAVAGNSFERHYLAKFIYNFFVLPGDATYLDICNYMNPELTFSLSSVSGIIGSTIIINVIIIYVMKKEKLLLLIVPYILLALFASIVYFSPHHVGIVTVFFIFVFWCCNYSEKKKNINFKYLSKLIKNDRDKAVVKKLPGITILIVLIVSGIYSLTASINEVKYQYGEGRLLSQFIKENNLENYKIFSSWKLYNNNKTGVQEVETHIIGNISVLPYFDKNIFYNFNSSDKSVTYLTHKIGTEKEDIKRVNEAGIPDVVIGYGNISLVFDGRISYKDYACVYEAKGSSIWKTQVEESNFYVYVRKELLKEFPKLKQIKIENDYDKYNG